MGDDAAVNRTLFHVILQTSGGNSLELDVTASEAGTAAYQAQTHVRDLPGFSGIVTHVYARRFGGE